MAERDEILAVLRDASGEEPVFLRTADLPRLQAEDLPEDVAIQAVDKLDSRGISHLGLNGVLARGTSTPLAAYMDEEVWRREAALLIAECKNWSAKCGKDEFVLFRSKLENRTGRVSCGFLISWNGFAETITAEMLRGTKDDLLIVPISGEDLRSAVREGNFPERLKKLHTDAVFL